MGNDRPGPDANSRSKPCPRFRRSAEATKSKIGGKPTGGVRIGGPASSPALLNGRPQHSPQQIVFRPPSFVQVNQLVDVDFSARSSGRNFTIVAEKSRSW